MAPLSIEQESLLRIEIGRQGQVVIGRQRPEDRNSQAYAQVAGHGIARRQHAAFALHARVGHRQEGHIDHGHAEKLERGVFVEDRLLFLVVDDPLGAHLPERRLVRIILAGRAGGVGGAVQHHHIALRPLGAGAGHMRFFAGVSADGVDEAFLEVVGQLETVRIGDRAILLGQLGVAPRMDPVAVPVIEDLVSLKSAALIIDLNLTPRLNGVGVLVVDQFLSLQEQTILCLSRRLGLLFPRGGGMRGGGGESQRRRHQAQRRPRPGGARGRLMTQVGANTPPHSAILLVQ